MQCKGTKIFRYDTDVFLSETWKPRASLQKTPENNFGGTAKVYNRNRILLVQVAGTAEDRLGCVNRKTRACGVNGIGVNRAGVCISESPHVNLLPIPD